MEPVSNVRLLAVSRSHPVLMSSTDETIRGAEALAMKAEEWSESAEYEATRAEEYATGKPALAVLVGDAAGGKSTLMYLLKVNWRRWRGTWRCAGLTRARGGSTARWTRPRCRPGRCRP